MISELFQNKSKPNSQQQQQTNDLMQSTPYKPFNQLQLCRPYPFEASIYYRILVASLSFVFLAGTLLTFKLTVPDPHFLGVDTQIVKFYASSQELLWQGMLALLKIIIISNIVLEIILKKHEEKYKIIHSTVTKIKKFIRIFIEIDFHLSSLLVLTQSSSSLIQLFVSAAIISFSIIFLQNYYEGKDRFYIGKFTYFLIFRSILIVGSVSNGLVLLAGKNIIYLIVYHTTSSLFILMIYLINGWIVYKDSLLRWGTLTFISLYLTISLNMLIYYSFNPRNGPFIIHTVLAFVSIQCFLYLKVRSLQINAVQPNSKIEEKYFVLSDLLQKSYFQTQQQAFITALLKFHSQVGCSNDKCYSLQGQVYDSKKLKYCESNSFYSERISLSKFYLKCQFQKYLQSNPNCFVGLISYCQLFYWKFRNMSLTIYWLNVIKANIKKLSFGTLIKFNGFYDLVKKQSQNFSELLYNRRLDIEHLIDAESTYGNIKSRINLILKRRLSAWNEIQKQQIDLSLVRQKIQPTFNSINQISQDWKKISKYLKYSSAWKRQYLFFIVYVKNQKIKNKVLEQFESNTEKTIDLRKYIKSGNSLELKSLFNDDTCCLNIQLKDSKAFIKRASSNFAVFTEYSLPQMINADLSTLLPAPSALYHLKLINSMYSTGKFSDESVYRVNQVYLINKSGFIIPVFKIFKQFINQGGQLEYVCFLKKADVKEVVILTNQYLQIQHFTQNFREQLQILKEESQNIKKINLASMIPSLLEKIEFSSYQNQHEELFCKKANLQEQQTELQCPSDFTDIFSFCQNITKYKAKVDSPQGYLKCISQLQAQIRSNCNKFSISLKLSQIHNSQCKYFEIKLPSSQLKKQLKPFKITNIQKTSFQKFGYTSTTAESRSSKEDIVKPIKRQSKNNPIFSNIFIKEQNNKAPHRNVYLQSLKYIWLFFMISLAVMSNVNLITLSLKFRDIKNFSNKIGSILQINFLSSNNLAYYQSYFLNATQLSQVSQKIANLSARIQSAFKQDSFQQIVFDKKVNSASIYLPLTALNSNESYNQIDLVFFVQSLFRSLAVQTNLTSDTPLYKLLLNYYFPSFMHFTKSAKQNLHQSFQQYVQQIDVRNTLIYSVQSLLFIAIILATIFTSLKFFRAMFEMMKIHCQFNSKEIKRIIFYYKKTLSVMNNIKKLQAASLQSQNENDKFGEQRQVEDYGQNNLNKRSKDISLGKKQIKSSIYYILKVAFCLSCLIGFTFWGNSYLYTLIKPIVNIEAYGYQQFYYSPNRILTSLIVANKHIDSKQLVSQQSYKQIIENAFAQMNTPFIAAPLFNTKFYTFIQNVYFLNLCQAYADSLQANSFTKTECQDIVDSSFTRGLVAYTGFQYNKINQIYNSDQKLTPNQIKQYYRSLQYSSFFMTNLVSIWQAQFSDLCDQSLFVIKSLLISENLIILFVILLGFVTLFNSLERQYKFYKQFYLSMMPQYIISQEKIIKSKLFVISFL